MSALSVHTILCILFHFLSIFNPIGAICCDYLQVENFNWNLQIFLDVIESYKRSANKANPTTFKLLEQTLDKISDLLETVDEVGSDENDVILCKLDENIFDTKQTIFCRICKVSDSHGIKFFFKF